MTLSLEQKQQLTSQGYSSEFADQLSKKIFKALIEVHSSLIVKFSHQELVQITTLTHAGTILRVIKENLDLLQEQGGFNDNIQNWGILKNNIINIAQHEEGVKTLRTLKSCYPFLIKYGFNTQDIFQMACDYKSYKKFQNIKVYCDILLEFGFTNTDIVEIIKEKKASNNISQLLRNIKKLKEQIFSPNVFVKAFQYLENTHPKQFVKLEAVQAQSMRWKKFIQLKKDFFGAFEQMEQLTCYYYPHNNQSFNAILNFAQTDNDAADPHIFAHYFACYMNNLYATVKNVETPGIQENPYRAEGPIVYIQSYSSFYNFLKENNKITPSFPPDVESLPMLYPNFLKTHYNFDWLIQQLDEIESMEIAQQRELNRLVNQLREELNSRRKCFIPEQAEKPQPVKRKRQNTPPAAHTSNLVEILAQSNHDQKNIFFIDAETALALKRFSSEQLQNMGIQSVKKHINNPEYIVILSNIQQFKQFLAHYQPKEIIFSPQPPQNDNQAPSDNPDRLLSTTSVAYGRYNFFESSKPIESGSEKPPTLLGANEDSIDVDDLFNDHILQDLLSSLTKQT